MAFSARGVLLLPLRPAVPTSQERGGLGPRTSLTRADERRAVLRVPWWAIEGFSADHVQRAPDGRSHQVIEIVTDAGILELLCPATEVGGVLASLAMWARRWRLARSPLVRRSLRLTVLTLAAMTSLALTVPRAVAPLGRPVAPLARAAVAPVGRSLTPIARPAARVVAVAGSWVGDSFAPIGRLVARRPIGAVAAVAAVPLAVMLVVAPAGPAAPSVRSIPVAAANRGFDSLGMSKIMSMAAWVAAGSASELRPASAPPSPAPPTVADEPPLTPHEVFGFAPYWTIGREATYDVAGFSTIAYFSLTANGNGTLQESGTGWDGYQSQAFADLVSRAHAAGERVVLTVNCFSQQTLDRITSSPSAQSTLAGAIVGAIEAKNLDGVNIDFEGQGSADQAGLTSLVTTVATAVRAANPHYQVTMDTYASSAGDPAGFYDIPALAPIVDGFFVMSYDLNLSSAPNPASPITSAEFSDLTAAAQYAAVVPPSKVILGTSYFGYAWPTTNGTMDALPTGTPTPVSYGQVVADGYPLYWDPVTDTAWTSYEVGDQWYEVYVEDPASVYMVAQLAQTYGLAGVGAWAMGMDGNDPQMTAALDGNAQPVPGGTGPASTSSSGAAAVPIAAPPSLPNSPPATSSGGSSSTTTTAPTGSGTGSSGSTTTTTTTTTTQPPASGGGSPSYRYSGVFDGQTVSLTDEPATTPVPSGTPALAGTLTGLSTTDPALSCLTSSSAPPLDVWQYPGQTSYLVTARTPGDCVSADFTFPVSGSGSSSTAATTTEAATAGEAATTGEAG
jgi:hypothetical protein